MGISSTYLAMIGQSRAGVIGSTLIGTQTLAVGASRITFTSVPAYRVYMVVFQGSTGGDSNIGLQFNGDTAANYQYQQVYASHTTLSAYRYTGETYCKIGNGDTGVNTTTVAYLFVGSATKMKTCLAQSDKFNANAIFAYATWNNTADLVTQISLYAEVGGFEAGAVASLYGVV